jgi:biotin-(acetyl-CoA carboxylase) ligase
VVNVSSTKPLETLKNKVKEVVTKALDADIDLDEFKEEVWNDLSAIYYKYETEEQKKAFREVMYEICEKIKESKWDSVYKRLYREEQKEKIF